MAREEAMAAKDGGKKEVKKAEPAVADKGKKKGGK